MKGILIFLGEHIRKVKFTFNMFDLDKVRLHRFTHCIFSDLNMSEALSGGVTGPGDTSGIVVVDHSRWLHEFIGKVKTVDNIVQLEKAFCAFVRCINFSLSGTSGSYCLAFRNPMERATEIDEETR